MSRYAHLSASSHAPNLFTAIRSESDIAKLLILPEHLCVVFPNRNLSCEYTPDNIKPNDFEVKPIFIDILPI